MHDIYEGVAVIYSAVGDPLCTLTISVGAADIHFAMDDKEGFEGDRYEEHPKSACLTASDIANIIAKLIGAKIEKSLRARLLG